MSEIGSSRISSVGAGAPAAAERIENRRVAGNRSSRTPPDPTPTSGEDELLFNSIPELAGPNIDQHLLTDILKRLGVDLFESSLSGEVSVIKFDQNKLQTLAKDNQKKLQKMLKKLEKRKKSGLLGKIFSWIAAALGTILGTVLAIVTFGTGSAASAALIAASTTLAVSLTIASATGGMEKLTEALASGFSKMLEAFGMDAKKAKRVAKIMAQVVIAIVVIVVQIILLVLSGGTNIEGFVNEMVNKIASFTVKAVNITMALISMAGAGAATATGVFQFEALHDQADMAENKAFLRKMQTLIEAEQDMIEEILNDLMNTQTNMGQLIREENENRGILADIDAQPSAV